MASKMKALESYWSLLKWPGNILFHSTDLHEPTIQRVQLFPQNFFDPKPSNLKRNSINQVNFSLTESKILSWVNYRLLPYTRHFHIHETNRKLFRNYWMICTVAYVFGDIRSSTDWSNFLKRFKHPEQPWLPLCILENRNKWNTV